MQHVWAGASDDATRRAMQWLLCRVERTRARWEAKEEAGSKSMLKQSSRQEYLGDNKKTLAAVYRDFGR